jgi:hypothetical protein
MRAPEKRTGPRWHPGTGDKPEKIAQQNSIFDLFRQAALFDFYDRARTFEERDGIDLGDILEAIVEARRRITPRNTCDLCGVDIGLSRGLCDRCFDKASYSDDELEVLSAAASRRDL